MQVRRQHPGSTCKHGGASWLSDAMVMPSLNQRAVRCAQMRTAKRAALGLIRDRRELGGEPLEPAIPLTTPKQTRQLRSMPITLSAFSLSSSKQVSWVTAVKVRSRTSWALSCGNSKDRLSGTRVGERRPSDIKLENREIFRALVLDPERQQRLQKY